MEDIEAGRGCGGHRHREGQSRIQVRRGAIKDTGAESPINREKNVRKLRPHLSLKLLESQ